MHIKPFRQFVFLLGMPLILLNCTNQSTRAPQEMPTVESEERASSMEEISNNLEQSWQQLYNYEGHSILNLLEALPSFDTLLSKRMGTKYSLLTDLKATAAEIRRTDDYLWASGTIRHGFAEDGELDFYSTQLIIDITQKCIYVLHLRSLSQEFDFYFDQQAELPPLVIEALESFYLRPPTKKVKDWNILDYYQLLSFQLTNPIALKKDSYTIGHHYDAEVDKVKTIVDLKNGFIEMVFEHVNVAFSKSIQIALFRKKDGKAIIGVSGYNNHPAWKGGDRILQFYELSPSKRLEKATNKVLSAQKLSASLFPQALSARYEGQEKLGLYFLSGTLPQIGTSFKVQFNFSNLIDICEGRAPEELDIPFEEEYLYNDEWYCPATLKEWHQKEIQVDWDPGKGIFISRHNPPFDAPLSSLRIYAYDPITLSRLVRVQKQLLLENPKTYLLEDPLRQTFRLAVQQGDRWMTWVPDPTWRIAPTSQIDSLRYFDFDGEGSPELILFYAKKEEEGSSASYATQYSQYLQIWRIDPLYPYFNDLIACREEWTSKSEGWLAFQTKASLKTSLNKGALMLHHLKGEIRGTQNAKGEFLMIDDMSNDTVVLGAACAFSHLDELEGLHQLLKGKLENTK